MENFKNIPSADLFFSRDKLSERRQRFSDHAAIGFTVMCEKMIESLAVYSTSSAMNSKPARKTVQPIHCINDGLSESPFFSIVRTFPSYTHVSNCISAYADWRVQCDMIKVAENKRVRKINSKRKNADNKEKPTYNYPEAPEITIPSNTQETNEENTGEDNGQSKKKQPLFYHYVQKICKNVRDSNDMFKQKQMKFSNEIKCLFSNFIEEFLHKISPMIRIFLDSRKTKTVGPEIAKFVVRTLFADAVSHTEEQEMLPVHKEVLALMDAKIQQASDYKINPNQFSTPTTTTSTTTTTTTTTDTTTTTATQPRSRRRRGAVATPTKTTTKTPARRGRRRGR